MITDANGNSFVTIFIARMLPPKIFVRNAPVRIDKKVAFSKLPVSSPMNR